MSQLPFRSFEKVGGCKHSRSDVITNWDASREARWTLDNIGEARVGIRDQAKSIADKVGLTFIVRSVQRRRRRRALRDAQINPLTLDQLAAQLRSLGVVEGDAVMLHSSLSSLGYVEGGPETVLDALISVLGQQGTLLVPTYPVADWSMENLRNLPVSEPASPSQMGAITNCLLKREGAVRSLHPTHSWSGIGRDAEYLLRDHHQSITPCGPDSPFDRLLEIDGSVMILGSPWGSCTFWHAIEDRIEFPFNVYHMEEFAARVRFPDGEIRRIPFKLHDPELVALRIDSDEDHAQFTLDRMRSYGLVREGAVGFGIAFLLGAREFLEGQKLLLEDGITAYKGMP